jgi:DNA-binding NtrC family response regulator
VEQLSDRIRGVQLAEQAPSAEASVDISFSESYSLYDHLSRFERQFILKALKEKKGVKKHAAALLNIPESTLRLKIKQYDIDADQFDTAS